MERSLYELFTGWRDLQYLPADLAKDSLPLFPISLFTHPNFHCAWPTPPNTHSAGPVLLCTHHHFHLLWSLYGFSNNIFVCLLFSSYSSFFHLFVPDSPLIISQSSFLHLFFFALKSNFLFMGSSTGQIPINQNFSWFHLSIPVSLVKLSPLLIFKY